MECFFQKHFNINTCIVTGSGKTMTFYLHHLTLYYDCKTPSNHKTKTKVMLTKMAIYEILPNGKQKFSKLN